MSAPTPQPFVPDDGTPNDSIDLLGRHAAELAAAVGRNAGLLIEETGFRINRTIRELIFILTLSVTAVIAAVVGYGLLVRELAVWIAQVSGFDHPEPVRIAIYAVSAIIPIVLLRLHMGRKDERELAAMERRHVPSSST